VLATEHNCNSLENQSMRYNCIILLLQSARKHHSHPLMTMQGYWHDTNRNIQNLILESFSESST